MNDFFLFLTAIAVIFGSIFGLIVGVEYLDCRGLAAAGYETKWTWGCYVKVGDKWLPKNYVFGKANEIRIEKKP